MYQKKMDESGEHQQSSADVEQDQNVLGIIASPGFCERVAHDIEEELCAYLSKEINGSQWRVDVVTDPLTGSNVDLGKVVEEVDSWDKARPEWDFAISLTDLPVRVGEEILIARASPGRGIGVISVPPLGVFRVSHRVRAMILQVLQHLWYETAETKDEWRKIGHQDAEPLASPQAEGDVEYGAPGKIAHLKLLAGMVYANRPWRLFPSFKKTISAAFATGGYGLIFTTLWQIGNLYGMTRLVSFMFLAMGILTVWIIVAHNLWEPKPDNGTRYLWGLYNTTTLVTVASGVIFSYAVIFVLLFFASFFYIPAALLEDTIGTEVNTMSYLRVAWVTASLATIVGAIGAGLEESEAVRNATFGWRQHNRWLQHDEQRQEEGEDEEELEEEHVSD